MAPMPVSRTSSESIPDQLDRPERSRNAKAQARHRAKRKAYIEQLETTVTKLQVALALSPEQVAALPAPVLRIRELEEENESLHREVDALRRQLEDRNARLRPDLARRHNTLAASPYAADRADYDARRRRLADPPLYLQSHSPPPPPLLLPPSTAPAASHTHTHSQGAAHTNAYARSALPSYVMYQMPGTPTTSSGASTASSTSPFSPCDYTPPPTTTAAPARPGASVLAYGPGGQYEYVKVEEDAYHGHAGYAPALPPFAGSQSSLNHWQTYSAQRS